MRKSASLLLASFLFLAGSPARGQAIDIEQFRPQIDGRGLFNTEAADSHHQWQWGVGFILSYARNPLVVSQGRDKIGDLVNNRLTGNILFSLGLLSWLEAGLALPIGFYNDQNGNLAGGTQAAGLGTLRLQFKLKVLTEARHGVGLSFLPAFAFPTGDQDGFLGQSGLAFSTSLLLDKSVSAVRFLVNLGFTARSDGRFGGLRVEDELFWKFGIGWRVAEPIELGAELVGATALASPFTSDERQNPLELLFGARVLLTDRLQLIAGLGPGLTQGYGTPTFRFFTGVVYSPHERDADNDRVRDRRDQCPLVPGRPVWAGCPSEDMDKDDVPNADDACPTVPGAKENKGCPWPDSDKDGIPDDKDRCPTVPGPKENQGCPWPDTDKDGIPDNLDRCPRVPGPKENQGCPFADRDRDGIPDKDDRCPDVPGPKENQGCPWPDTDKDGIPDKDDRCPKVPGPKENQGCPYIQETDTEVKLGEQVLFKTGSARILKKSFAILDRLANKLKTDPKITLIEVQGHTDDVGSRAFNKRLSNSRARSVRTYLIRKGVAASRLKAQGYGEDRPVVKVEPRQMTKDALKKARALNRRVQFIILKRTTARRTP